MTETEGWRSGWFGSLIPPLEESPFSQLLEVGVPEQSTFEPPLDRTNK